MHVVIFAPRSLFCCTMSAEDPFTVVIVGAGLGGLCLANGLVNGVRDEAVDGDRASAEQLVAPPNVRVIVLERDASANDREQGYYIGTLALLKPVPPLPPADTTPHTTSPHWLQAFKRWAWMPWRMSVCWMT